MNMCAYDSAYYNEETGKESVDGAKYTYNTGTMIWAGALLYEITQNNIYKEDVYISAEGGLLFASRSKGDEPDFYPVSPWFNLYLLQGYLAIYQTFGDNKYIEHMKESLDYAWIHAKNEAGLVTKNWKKAIYSNNSLLDVAGTSEAYALLAIYEKGLKK